MLAIETLVPDFNLALERVPGNAEACRVLAAALQPAGVSSRTGALVRVAVAQRAGGDYARWVMARLAEREWVGAEDIFLASAGTARDAIDAQVVKAAWRIAGARRHPEPAGFRALAELLGNERATEVLAHVTLAMLACDVLESIAPNVGTSQPARPGA